MKKRILVVIGIVAVSVTLVFSGCGKKKNEREIKVGDNAGYTIAKDFDKGINLPENYPEKIFPMYKKARVITASEQNGAVNVLAVTDDKLAKVVNYYKDLIKDTEKLLEESDETMYMVMGSMEGYTYTISINEEDEEEFNTSITLVLMEGETSLDELMGDMGNGLLDDDKKSDNNSTDKDSKDEKQIDDKNTEEKEDHIDEKATEEDIAFEKITENVSTDYKIKAGIEVPKGYNEKDFPIYDKSDTIVCHTEGGPNDSSGMILYATKVEQDKIIEFYTEKVGSADDFAVMDMYGSKSISGVYKDQSFQIMVGANMTEITQTDATYKTMVQVMLMP